MGKRLPAAVAGNTTDHPLGKSNNRFNVALIHAVIWIAYILYEASILLIIDDVHLNVWETGLNFVLYAGVFYLNSLVIFPRVVNRKKYVAVAGTLLVLAALVVLRYLLYRHVIPFLDDRMLHPFTTGRRFLAESVWRGVYYIMLSAGYFFALNSIRTEQERRRQAEQERRLREMEKTLLEAEILNLKSQINPHFLYNALNFFYARIYPYSEKTANGILLLSDMMRYALKEDGLNGKVMLADEVKHLENYIAMNQLRFDDQLQVRFELDGSLSYRMIMPLLLITFVENCFKHGELFDPAHPLVIRLGVSNDELFFYTHNKKATGTRPKSSGIGLVNIKRRLDLVYPSQYTLRLKDEPHSYTCILTLNL